MNQVEHAPSSLQHSLWPTIAPHLQDGEVVYWVGRALNRRLWDPIAGSVLLGLILLSPFALSLMFFGTISYDVALRSVQAASPGWSPEPHHVEQLRWLVSLGMALGGICSVWCIAAPLRCWWALSRVAYAVTSRRVLVVNGFAWLRLPAGWRIPEQSFDREQVRDREVLWKDRDICFRKEFHPGIRAAVRLRYGFQALDDISGAEAAIKRLLAERQA